LEFVVAHLVLTGALPENELADDVDMGADIWQQLG
jgi:hypothetical protein